MLGLAGCAERGGEGRGCAARGCAAARRVHGAARLLETKERHRRTDRRTHPPLCLATCRLASCCQDRDGRKEPPSLGRRKAPRKLRDLQRCPCCSRTSAGRKWETRRGDAPCADTSFSLLLRNHFQTYSLHPDLLLGVYNKIFSLQYKMLHMGQSRTC